MSSGSLTPLQDRILLVLSGVGGDWTLTGGGALAGFHLGHRTTRDLDLLWRDRSALDALPGEVAAALRSKGLTVASLQTSPAFHRFHVSEGDEVCIVDLVAESIAPIEHPVKMMVADRTILVDTAHEILTNKLCALLSRAELRDLIDVKALLEAGGDLTRALADAPRKDAGFSPLTLAWVLQGLDLQTLARFANLGPAETEALAGFVRSLVERLVAPPRPSERR